jgi:hypothetical protein
MGGLFELGYVEVDNGRSGGDEKESSFECGLRRYSIGDTLLVDDLKKILEMYMHEGKLDADSSWGHHHPETQSAAAHGDYECVTGVRLVQLIKPDV